jgi:hypothetical protein
MLPSVPHSARWLRVCPMAIIIDRSPDQLQGPVDWRCALEPAPRSHRRGFTALRARCQRGCIQGAGVTLGRQKIAEEEKRGGPPLKVNLTTPGDSQKRKERFPHRRFVKWGRLYLNRQRSIFQDSLAESVPVNSNVICAVRHTKSMLPRRQFAYGPRPGFVSVAPKTREPRRRQFGITNVCWIFMLTLSRWSSFPLQ